MINLDDSMKGHKATDGQSHQDRESEAQDLLDKISGQRSKLKEMRETTKSPK